MKLLVIRYGAMGDLVHVSPALRAVTAHLPSTELHFLTSPLYTPWLTTWPELKRVWTYEKSTGWRGLWTLAQSLQEQHYDGVVNLHPSFRTWVLLQALGRPTNQTYQKQKFRIKGQALLETPRYHAVEDFYQPFRRLLSLPELTKQDLTPSLTMPKGSPIAVKPKGERWIAIIPGVGSKRGNRAWPLENFQAFIQTSLQEASTRIFLLGGPDESAMGAMLASDPRVENRCGRQSLLESSSLLSQCDMVLGGDTGPLHLAAALGVPTVALFGPTDPRRTGPLGEQVIKILTPPKDLDCWPCEYPQCPLTGTAHLACMKALSVEDACAAYGVS